MDLPLRHRRTGPLAGQAGRRPPSREYPVEGDIPLPKVRHPDRTGLHLRVVLPGGVAVGPGRADLLQGIAELGSISAAGRAMGMSYRRAWVLVDETSQAFGAPVVEAAPGGANGGGATLTVLGRAVLATYRAIEAKADQAARTELDALAEMALDRKSPGAASREPR